MNDAHTVGQSSATERWSTRHCGMGDKERCGDRRRGVELALSTAWVRVLQCVQAGSQSEGEVAEGEGTRACVHSGMCSSTSDIVTQTVPRHRVCCATRCARDPKLCCQLCTDSLTASVSEVEHAGRGTSWVGEA